MSSTSEQGHNRNVANFDKLIFSCLSYGETYKPSKTVLSIAAMQALDSQAKNSLNSVTMLTSTWKNAVAERINAFKPLDKLISRVNNALIASDTTPETDNNVKSIVRKLQGRRATPKRTEEEKRIAAEAGKSVTEISTSRMSFNSRLENFDKLIKLLASIPAYAPNEDDLKVATLAALHADLEAKNLAVISAEIALNNARIVRDDIMYKDLVGLVDVATDVKTYVKSVFGTSSPHFKLVGSLKFTKGNN